MSIQKQKPEELAQILNELKDARMKTNSLFLDLIQHLLTQNNSSELKDAKNSSK